MGSQQPRVDGGRFGEKIEVGVQRRLTETLRRALGHDGTVGVQSEPDLDARLDAQLDVAVELDAAVADSTPQDVSALVTAGKRLAAAAEKALATVALPGQVVLEYDGPSGRAFTDTDDGLWTHAHGTDRPSYLGKATDLAAYDRFLAFLDDHGLREPGDPAPQEAPVFDDDIDARLAAQEKRLVEQVIPLEAKGVRKWDPDKHPRDWRGRFASINSTVSLPDSSGGGEGRVVAATGNNHIRVRRADGTEIDVDAKDTEVTASAAANAAADGFTRAGQGSGFARAGGTADLAGGPAEAPGVAKAPSKAPRGKPKPAAKPPTEAAPGESEWEGDVAGKPATLTRVPDDDPDASPRWELRRDGREAIVDGATVEEAREAAARQAGVWDGGGYALGEHPPRRTSGMDDAKPKPDAAKPPAEAAVEKVRASELRVGDEVDFLGMGPGGPADPLPVKGPIEEIVEGDEIVTVTVAGTPHKLLKDSPIQRTAPAAAQPAEDTQTSAPAVDPRFAVTDEDRRIAAGDTEREGIDRADSGVEPPDGGPAAPDAGTGEERTGEELHQRVVNEGRANEYVGRTVRVRANPTSDAESEETIEGTVTAVRGLSSQQAYAASRDGADGSEEPLLTIRLDTVGADGETDNTARFVYASDPVVFDPADSSEELPTGEGEKPDGSPAPQGGEWGEAPDDSDVGGIGDDQHQGSELAGDDGIDRSTWTDGVAPGGFDGTGTRPDGSAWGSGYPEGDPRQDPAYDQYTTDMDTRIKATLEKYGETETLLDKVGGAPNAYQPERHAEHDAIIDELMADIAARVPRQNRAVIMAGPPGAGKTTVIVTNGDEFGVEWDAEKRRPGNYAVVNPDDMKELMVERGMIPEEYQESGLSEPEMASFIHEESSWLAERLLTRLRADGYNVILDGTFAGRREKQVGKVHALREEGYSVKGVLVDGTVERSLTNAGGRHRKAPRDPGGRFQGRYVPIGHIESNRPKEPDAESSVFGRPHRNASSENIEAVQDAFDEGVHWYDNSTGESRAVHSTEPNEGTAALRRIEALQRRVQAVSSDTERARLQAELDALVTYFDENDLEVASLSMAWLDRGGAELEAKVLEALAAQPQVKAEGGADRNRGGAERLRRYWVRGAGAAKIGWGTEGDFMRCVALVSEHMDPVRAKGYCNLRHQDAVGKPPGQGAHAGRKWLGRVERKEALPNENPDPTGVMIALYPADDIVSALALENGEAASDLHVTLAYLGTVDEVGDTEQLLDAVAALAARHGDLDAAISGLGRWEAGEDGDAFVALVDSPELGDLRDELVGAVESAGYTVRRDHGFTPHITLAYLTPEDPTPVERIDALPATFQFLSVAIGPDVYDFPLAADDVGAAQPTAATQGEGDAPYDDPDPAARAGV